MVAELGFLNHSAIVESPHFSSHLRMQSGSVVDGSPERRAWQATEGVRRKRGPDSGAPSIGAAGGATAPTTVASSSIGTPPAQRRRKEDFALHAPDTAGKKDEIAALFSAVRERVDGKEGLSAPPEALWPYRIWERGYGVCDRQAWVLCELATQLGYETQIVYLRDPKTGVSPHTVCEIRKGRDQVWLADPYLDALLSGVSAESLAADPARLQSIWPGKDALHAAMARCDMFTPAFPQDYRPRNERLGRRLREALGEQSPRFGEDPAERMRRYHALHTSATGSEPRFQMVLWGFPWLTLRVDMLQRGREAEPSAGRP